MYSERNPTSERVRAGSAVSSAAAVCLLLLFFMPWFSACGASLSGADIAGGIGGVTSKSPLLLGIPLVGLVVAIVGVKNLLRPAATLARWAGYIVALASYPFIALLWLYVSLQNTLNDPLLDLRSLVRVEFGFYGTLLAALAMIVGTVWQWRQARADLPGMPQQSRLTPSRAISAHSPPAAMLARPRAWLQGQAGGFVNALELMTELTRVGAGAGCEIRLSDPNALAEHALIRYASGRYYLQDQGGPAGTQVNGQRVSAVALQDGDLITIGRTLMRFRQQ